MKPFLLIFHFVISSVLFLPPVFAQEPSFYIDTRSEFVFLKDEQVVFDVIVSGLSRSMPGVSFRIADWDGKIVETGVVPLIGQAVQLKPQVQGPGWYRVEFFDVETGKNIHLVNETSSGMRSFFTFAVLDGSSILDAKGRFGICEHYLDRRNAHLMALAGISWLRTDVTWSNIQKAKGFFDWSRLDDIFKVADDFGIKILPIIDYGVSWASTAPFYESDFEKTRYMPKPYAYAWFVENLVKRYKDHARYWEVWNEPNIGFWKSPKEEYSELLKISYEEIKKADPSAVVLMGGTSGAPPDWIKMLAQQNAIDKFDVYNVHPYHYHSTPEKKLQKDLNGFIKTADAIDKKSIWITEVGAPTNVVSLQEQAAYLVRSAMISLSHGIEKFFWYELADHHIDPHDKEANFGILYTDLTPKPAYVAYAVLIRMLDNVKFERQVPLNSSTAYGYVFSGKNKHVLVLWSVKEKENVDIDVGSSGVDIVNIMGNKIAMTTEGGMLHLSLSQYPVYILINNPLPDPK